MSAHRAILSNDTDIVRFIMAGNATVTVRNANTGVRWTYRVRCKRATVADGRGVESPYFVSVMTGPDNEHHYSYIGYIPSKGSKEFRYGGSKAKLDEHHEAVRGFRWLWNLVRGLDVSGNPLPPTASPKGHIARYPHCEVWHEGVCGCCGRKLTVPESIEHGIGPECAKWYLG